MGGLTSSHSKQSSGSEQAASRLQDGHTQQQQQPQSQGGGTTIDGDETESKSDRSKGVKLCGWRASKSGKQTDSTRGISPNNVIPGGAGGGGGGGAGGGVVTTSSIRKERLKRLKEERPELTERQMEVIVETWNILQSDLDRVGSQMFVKLFETYPDVRGAFGPFKSMAADDVRLSQELRAHGLRVLSTVSQVLEKRGNTEDVVQHLYDLGSKHITFNAKGDYIDIVSQQFLFAVEPALKEHWTAEVEQAWADLFRLIAHVMREGMIL